MLMMVGPRGRLVAVCWSNSVLDCRVLECASGMLSVSVMSLLYPVYSAFLFPYICGDTFVDLSLALGDHLVNPWLANVLLQLVHKLGPSLATMLRFPCQSAATNSSSCCAWFHQFAYCHAFM